LDKQHPVVGKILIYAGIPEARITLRQMMFLDDPSYLLIFGVWDFAAI